MYNANSGNVGVGTNSPTTLLHVEDTAIPTPILLNDGFEDSTLAPFTTGGDSNWSITTTAGQFNTGTVAVKSGNIGDSQVSWIETTVNVVSPGGANVSFFYKTDSEDVFDTMLFYIDGVDQTGGGLNSSTFVSLSYPLTTGAHTLRWSYEKDGSDSVGADEMYLDDILVQNILNAAIIKIVDGNQADGKVLTSDATGSAVWKDTAHDDDWRFLSGLTESDPLYRTGSVTIGANTTTTHNLDVDNGSPTGTEVGIGSIEYILDDSSQTLFSDNVGPLTDAGFDLGTSARKWRDIFLLNAPTVTSDMTLKKNVKAINYGLDALMQLKAISYQWKADRFGETLIPENKKETHLGFSAQQLLKIIPEVVKTHTWKALDEASPKQYTRVKNEKIGVRYSEIIPVTVKAIQEQQQQYKALMKINAEILKRLSALEKENVELKMMLQNK